MTSSPVLTATGLVKRYGELAALDDVSLTIRAGESVAVMGASGSGKTTLLHTLASVIAPDAGSVVLSPPGAEATELVGLSEGARARAADAPRLRLPGAPAAPRTHGHRERGLAAAVDGYATTECRAA